MCQLQAFFFKADVGPLAMVLEALGDSESSPRSMARNPNPIKGEYIDASLPADGLSDPSMSPTIAVVEVTRAEPKMRQVVLNQGLEVNKP